MITKFRIILFNTGYSNFRATVITIGLKMHEHIANILGDNEFIMGGAKPTLIDSVVFGFMSHRLYNPGPCSEFLKPIMSEKRFEKLIRHTDMMRQRYWPDWDQCKFQPKSV